MVIIHSQTLERTHNIEQKLTSSASLINIRGNSEMTLTIMEGGGVMTGDVNGVRGRHILIKNSPTGCFERYQIRK